MRGLIRILIPIACVEVVRMPLMMALIPDSQWTGLQTAIYVIGAVVCAWLPVLLVLKANRDNGFATVWDKAGVASLLTVPAGATSTLAYDINGAGDVVGLVVTPTKTYGIVWYANNTMSRLLPLPGHAIGWPSAINDNGLVGGSSTGGGDPLGTIWN